MNAQINKTSSCCEKDYNFDAVLIFDGDRIGITNVCRKCGYLFLDQMLVAVDGNKPGNQLVNFLTDTKTTLFIIQKLLSRIKYVYSTDPEFPIEDWAKTLNKSILNLTEYYDQEGSSDGPEIYI